MGQKWAVWGLEWGGGWDLCNLVSLVNKDCWASLGEPHGLSTTDVCYLMSVWPEPPDKMKSN